jgi:NAD(P)-dependent dehydrogenase (short-subunit alcohol dehydrogenase family)
MLLYAIGDARNRSNYRFRIAISGAMLRAAWRSSPARAAASVMPLQMSAEHIAYMRSKIPMNRFVEPQEIAALVCWLASEGCSFSTGAVFDISGGRATY